MTFLDRLKELGRDPNARAAVEADIALPASPIATSPEGNAELAGTASAYDRNLWRKKLRSVLDRLPASEPEWHDFVADAVALGLSREWIDAQLLAEFEWLIRRVISDRIISPQEERQLETARILIGVADADARRMLERSVAELQALYRPPAS